ncbi:MAG: sigma-70 family RNA polymerase sigma factor [Ramlibacter sp.]
MGLHAGHATGGPQLIRSRALFGSRRRPGAGVIQSVRRRVRRRMNLAPHLPQAPAGRSVRARPGSVTVAAPLKSPAPMPSHEEFNAWMAAVAQAADRQAFAALFKHFAPRIKGYLMRSGSGAEQAEELAQETMVQLWRRASTFDPARATLSTWVYTIARNLRIDHFRRTGGDPCEGEQPWDADQQPCDAHLPPEDLVQAAQRERGVRRALAELPPEQSLVLQLSFFEERPHAIIARDLGIPLGTVKSRIRLAVAQLRRKLDAFGS